VLALFLLTVPQRTSPSRRRCLYFDWPGRSDVLVLARRRRDKSVVSSRLSDSRHIAVASPLPLPCGKPLPSFLYSPEWLRQP
jgi:hypothetical protein